MYLNYLCGSLVLILLLPSTSASRIFKFKTLEPVKSYTTSEDQTATVNELLIRVLGTRSQEIKVEVLPESYDEDYAFVSMILRFLCDNQCNY